MTLDDSSKILRQSTWLRAPCEDDVIAEFPSCCIPPECVRAHSADYGPAWFASVDAVNSPLGGRFDLVDVSMEEDEEPQDEEPQRGLGTLYCANDVEAAVRERLGPALAGRRYIALSELHDTTVSVLYLQEDGLGALLADTCSANGFVTREISTMPDYTVTRAWAQEFCSRGFDGISYEPRSTPGRDRFAYAVFGPAGSSVQLSWSPHPQWWQVVIDSGVVLAHISGARAKVLD